MISGTKDTHFENLQFMDRSRSLIYSLKDDCRIGECEQFVWRGVTQPGFLFLSVK